MSDGVRELNGIFFTGIEAWGDRCVGFGIFPAVVDNKDLPF